MNTVSFYRRVIDATDQPSREAVKRGTAAVFRALRDRLTPEEAEQAVAQLPRDLKLVWDRGTMAPQDNSPESKQFPTLRIGGRLAW